MTTPRQAFESFVEGYLDEIASLRYAELCEEQPAPHGPIATGAAGVAYTLWRAGRALAAPALLDAARRWIREATDSRERAGGFDGPAIARRSLYFGPAGLDLVAALVDGASGGPALSRFAAAARDSASAGEPPDLLLGSAGYLAGASILAAHLEDAGAESLESELLDAVMSAEPPGQPTMGHGEAGALFAALGVYQRRRETPPAAIARRLEQLPAEVPGPPAGNFCRGPAGRAILWARAAAITRDPDHGDRAKRYADAAFQSPTDLPDLCCGLVGIGYAMLALSRLDPAGDWIERAERIALTALASEVETQWAHGLLKGEAGLFCLAFDLLHGSTRLPGIEPDQEVTRRHS